MFSLDFIKRMIAAQYALLNDGLQPELRAHGIRMLRGGRFIHLVAEHLHRGGDVAEQATAKGMEAADRCGVVVQGANRASHSVAVT